MIGIMRGIGRWVAAALVAAMAAGSGCDDREGVRLTFEAFGEACDRCDAATVLAVTDPKCFEAYDRLVEMARHGTREQVRELSPYQKFELIAMRHRLTREELRELDGQGWVRLSVERGWWAAAEGDPVFSLGRIRFRQPRAYAELLVDGYRTDLSIEFVRVGEDWLVDWAPLDEAWGDMLVDLARESGLSLDKFLLELEAADSGEPVPRSIWDPPAL